jgi:glycine cleavage system protein P-like pyridoxal-binding family
MSFKDFFLPGGEKKADDQPQPTEREEEIMTKLATKVVEWKMTVPAILFLESVKPLNFIGAQMMVFFEPFVQTIFDFRDYDTFRGMMERRENVERLLVKIEEVDAVALQKEKAARAARQGERRGLFSRFRRKSSRRQPPLPPENIPPRS